MARSRLSVKGIEMIFVNFIGKNKSVSINIQEEQFKRMLCLAALGHAASSQESQKQNGDVNELVRDMMGSFGFNKE